MKAEKKAKRLSAKKSKEEKETDPGLKEGLLQEGVAKNTLDIYQAHHDAKSKKTLKSVEKQMDKAVAKANAKLKEDLEGLPELDALDIEMSEAYQSPKKNNYSSKELRQAKGIAFDKRYKGGNMTGAAKAMEKIKKGLSDHPVAAKALRKANEENMKDEWLDLFDGVEDFNEDVYRGKLLEIPTTKTLLTNKSTHGFPINCTFTDTKSIVSRVRDTKIHHNEAKEVKFALSVKVFPYPNNIFSVWVFLMSICDKQDHL